jgi:hypothetical protein
MPNYRDVAPHGVTNGAKFEGVDAAAGDDERAVPLPSPAGIAGRTLPAGLSCSLNFRRHSARHEC